MRGLEPTRPRRSNALGRTLAALQAARAASAWDLKSARLFLQPQTMTGATVPLKGIAGAQGLPRLSASQSSDLSLGQCRRGTWLPRLVQMM